MSTTATVHDETATDARNIRAWLTENDAELERVVEASPIPEDVMASLRSYTREMLARDDAWLVAHFLDTRP